MTRRRRGTVVLVLVLATGAGLVPGTAPADALTTSTSRSRPTTLQVGDRFVVAGTELGCLTQAGNNHAIPGQKVVICFKSRRGALAPGSYIVALGATGRVVVAPITAAGNIGRAPVFNGRAAGIHQTSRQLTLKAGDQVTLAGTDLACTINDDASGIYPACFRGTATGGRPGSLAFAQTERFVAVVRFDSKGKTTKLVFRRLHGH